MADADKELKIAIKTTADTSGAVAADRAIDEVNRSAMESTPAADSVGKLTQAEIKAAEAAGLAAKKFNDAAIEKLRAGRASQSAGVDMSKMGMLANQASFQIGDFVTQVQMGTGAARAFGQQAPQLIGSLSSMGMVSGPVGIALAGVAVAIPLITMAIEHFSSANDTLKPKLDAVNEAIDKNAKLVTQAYEAHVRDQKAAEDAIQTWEELEKARDHAAISAISNAQKELEANQVLNEALGIQLDLIGAKADMERAAREESARQAMNAEAAKAAQRTIAIAGDTANLNELRSFISDLQKRAEESNRAIGFIQSEMRKDGLTSINIEGWENQLANEIQNKGMLEKAISGFKDQARELEQKIAVNLSKASDQIAAADVAIQEIGDTLESDNAVGTAKEVKERMKQQADDLKTILADITPLNETQRQAVTELQQIAADGKVTADETAALGRNLQTLLGGVQVGIAEYRGTTQQLIDLMKQMARNQDDLNGQVRSLQEQLKQRPR